MYDGENEIKRKRKNFLIIGTIIIVVLIVFIIFLSASSNGFKTSNKEVLSCTVETSREPDKGDTYTSPVVASVKGTSSKEVTIVERNIGLVENDDFNEEQYTVDTSGNTTLIGYVKDSEGNTATCQKEINVNLSKPGCILEVSEGTLGENNWYTTPVEVSFKSKYSNSSTISNYYIVDMASISTQKIGIDNNNDSLKVEKDGIYTITGIVKDEKNQEGYCTLEVKIDTEKPKCKLKVEKGTINTDKVYYGETSIVFESVSDEVSTVNKKGIGLNENYENDSYLVETSGETTITGYVKDEAGNKDNCSLTINHQNQEKPTCELEVVGSELNGQYSGKTIIRFKTKSTKKPAKIVEYGIGTIKDYQAYEANKKTFLNGQESIILLGDKDESIIPYGMIKDSNGEIGICSLEEIKVTTTNSNPTCRLEVKNGTKNGNSYSGNVTVGFKDAASSNGATIVRYGITAGENPTLNDQKTIDLGLGKYDVYGIVEDSNGKTSICGPLSVLITNGNRDFNIENEQSFKDKIIEIITSIEF